MGGRGAGGSGGSIFTSTQLELPVTVTDGVTATVLTGVFSPSVSFSTLVFSRDSTLPLNTLLMSFCMGMAPHPVNSSARRARRFIAWSEGRGHRS